MRGIIASGVDTPDIDTWPGALWACFDSEAVLAKTRSGTAYYRVLFAPSFHPECCVTVLDLGDTAELSLLTFRTNLWYWACYERQRANGKWLPAEPPPRAPRRWQETAVLDEGRLRRFREQLPATIPLLPEKVNCLGCDGMMVYCRFQKPGGQPQDSRTWGPSEPGTHGLAVAVHRVASEVLTQHESKAALAAVKAYQH